MERIEMLPNLSLNYSNEEIAASIGKIARENYAINHSETNRPKRIARRELVSLLNKKHENLNISDTLEFNELIRLSYEMNSTMVKEAIVETIKENIGNDSVYNPARLYPSNKVSQFSDKEKEDLTKKCNLLISNSKEVDEEGAKTKIETTLTTTQKLEFNKKFLGAGNADSAKKYAKDVLSGYELMIEEYEKIKNINLNLINDFHILRNELKYERDDVVQLLIDLFGNRAKQDYPELFDFSQIEWLDFENSWEKLNLSYNKINQNHQEFLQVADLAISDFGNSISSESSLAWKNLSSISKKRELNQGDLINAGVKIAFAAGAAVITGAINTRNKSKEVVAVIKRDVELLKLEMSEDNERIISDIFRLGKLYSKLSHSILPNYNEFIKSNSEIIVSELRPLYEKIMENPIIKKAKEENTQYINRQRFLEQKNIDFNNNLEFSKQEETRLSEILEMIKEEYDLVISLKPKKPFILIELFTLARASTIFENTMDEWNKYCKPVVDDYEFLQGEKMAELTKRELITQSISECEIELGSIHKKVSSNSEIIMNEFNKGDNSKDEIIKLVTVVKKIINASRNVLEIQLEQDLQKRAIV